MKASTLLRKVQFGMREFEDLLDRDEEDQPGILEPGLGDGRVVLILGPPGSGKSTLALQMAWGINLIGARKKTTARGKDVCRGQPAHCLYFALEQEARDLRKLARGLKWGNEEEVDGRIRDIKISPKERLSTAHDGRAGSRSAGWFGQVCGQDKGHSQGGLILVPKVTPRSLTDRSAGPEDLFARRLQDVHDLLDGYLRCRAGDGVPEPRCYYDPEPAKRPTCNKGGDVCPPLGLVVIDSLNVFGDQELTRGQIFALCDLFVRHGTIGVIIGEEYSSDHDSDSGARYHPAEYVADVVIRLASHRDQGHLVSTLQIVKSRYQAQVLGRHPYKIAQYDILGTGRGSSSGDRSGFCVFRSLHRQLSKHITPQQWSRTLSLGSPAINERLPKWITGGSPGDATKSGESKAETRPQAPILAMVGDFGAYKSAIGINFLLAGLGKTKGEGENGLLLSLQESVTPDIRQVPAFEENKDVRDRIQAQEHGAHGRAKPRTTGKSDSPPTVPEGGKKIIRRSFLYGKGKQQRELSVLSFRPGYLLAEEFVEATIAEIGRLTDGGRFLLRVVLDDMSEIPARFPLLAKSETAGRIFLPTLVDVIRGKGPIPILITGGTGQASEPEANLEMVADVVLKSARKSLYGRDTIVLTVSAHGLTEPQQQGAPLELSGRAEDNTLLVDKERLQGLIGLEGDSPRRADLGLSLYVETQNQLEEAERLEWCAKALLGQEARVKYFSPRIAEPLYEAWHMWQDLPLRNTEVLMFDEFCLELLKGGGEATGKGLASLDKPLEQDRISFPPPVHRLFRSGLLDKNGHCFGLPYFSNVLLLAWNEDSVGTEPSWLRSNTTVPQASRALWKALTDNSLKFDYDKRAWESQVCILLQLFGVEMQSLRKRFCGKKELGTDDGMVQRLLDFGTLVRRKAPEGSLTGHGGCRTQAGPAQGQPPAPTPGRRRLTDKPSVDELRGDAADPHADVWCHWYTTLRDMLHQHPDLAPKVRVAALPFGGFRGDWYLGMAAGSVSLETGWKVIQLLCARERDALKLDRGIGLPVWTEYYTAPKLKDGPAWPGAGKGQTLATVGGIWLKAKRRSEFGGYINVHGLFHEAFLELFGDGRSRKDVPVEEEVKRILQRLEARVRYVLGKDKGTRSARHS